MATTQNQLVDMKAALDDDDFGEHILMLFVGDITSVAYLEP